MSLIIFNRMMNQIPANKACETEEEVDDENYNFNNADVDSKSYLVNLYKNLKNCNYFLNSLIVNEQLDYVVISLFKNHQFSFGIKLFDSDTVFERVHFTCEDNHIIDYIDNEELPPKLIDVIEMFDFKNIYYNGCIISEIRDYRQSSTDFFNSYFILLKPTSLSLYNDVKKIIGLTNKTYSWTNTARLKLESKLIYLTSPKLCLDPNPCIGILSKKLSRKKLIFGNKLFLRLPRKRLKSIIARDQSKEFRLLNFLKIKKPLSSSFIIPKMKPNPIAIESQMKIMQTEYKDVEKLAKQLTEPKDCQSNELIKTEEYRMEFLDTTGTIITLTIFRRPYDDVYFGNIVNVKNGDSKSAPNFYLGTKEMKRRYIEQFIETFSENGKKLIKITQRIGNEEPKVKHTQAVEMYLLRQQQQQQQQNSAKLKIEQQQSITMKNGSNIQQQHQAPKPTIILNSLINNHQIHSTNAPSDNIVTTTAASTSLSSSSSSSSLAINNTSTPMTKLTPNQIVIKHSNLKLIQAANSNVINKVINNNNNHSTSMISLNTTTNNNNQSTVQQSQQQQPVLLNVNTTTAAGSYQNGTQQQQIPIRIPLSFSLQQLKSGQIALVPNTSLTNQTSSSSTITTGTAGPVATVANIQMTNNNNNNSQNVPVTFTNDVNINHHHHHHNQDHSQQNQNNGIQSNNNGNNNITTYLPTNVNFILQGNQVFTGKIG
ncbi:uncharacterized protein LOC113797657 isoform X2 [Dermatophagoides pteronyssinus]|uniref:Rho GTPase-activating protein gacF-like isoform X2 n=1 Tax=Dermatophagoides pteronyssinus TaxID=6956 RepID=A0A6P6YGD9_DERPT|nr:rho GTPase-activating protein gacF-like isoform X2 [Dermatophagoides pteronyssinus]